MMNGLFDLQIQQILSIVHGKGKLEFANPKANATSTFGLSKPLLQSSIN